MKRTCEMCQEEKLLAEFELHDGNYRRKCKECRRAIALVNRELNKDVPKTCSKCKQTKPSSEFFADSSLPSGYTAQCKRCKLEAQRTAYSGWTEEEYLLALDLQQGRCAICKGEQIDKRTNQLYGDHCSVTGTKRKLLCSKCNFGIGQFNHDPELLRAAITYLESFGSKHDDS